MVIEKCYQFITKQIDCDELKEKQIRYGLESIYNMLTKLIVLFFITFLFHLTEEYILLLVVYAIVKRYTYGLHAKTSLACWMTTIPIYMLGCVFIHYVHIPFYFIGICFVFSFVSFLLWAPADTPARPLIHKEIRRAQKVKACCICILLFMIACFIPYPKLTSSIIYSMFIQSVCINPITYKLTKTPFDNYKTYYKNHGLNY